MSVGADMACVERSGFLNSKNQRVFVFKLPHDSLREEAYATEFIHAIAGIDMSETRRSISTKVYKKMDTPYRGQAVSCSSPNASMSV